MNRIKNFLADTKQELTKVSWPTRKKVLALVMVIFVILVFVAVYVFVVDNILSFLVKAFESIKI
jgi:preprotein translocase subunit SecE